MYWKGKQIIVMYIQYTLAMTDIREILSRNLTSLMETSLDCRSQNALAKKSKVAQTTIGNYLRKDYVGYPNLEKIDALAHCFGLEAWNLIHPSLGNAEISEKELQIYRRFREDILKNRIR